MSTAVNQVIFVSGEGLVLGRLDIPSTQPTPSKDLYDLPYGAHILRGDYPNVYAGYYYSNFGERFRPGQFYDLPVNPKSAWSENLEDSTTFAEFKRLLMKDEAFLDLIGYMDAAHRHAHDSIRGVNALRPPAPESTGEQSEDSEGDSDDED